MQLPTEPLVWLPLPVDGLVRLLAFPDPVDLPVVAVALADAVVPALVWLACPLPFPAA
jgi:hypothetical protein